MTGNIQTVQIKVLEMMCLFRMMGIENAFKKEVSL